MQKLTKQKTPIYYLFKRLVDPYPPRWTHRHNTMASLLPIILYNIFLIIIYHSFNISSENTSFSDPTIAQCTPNLLPLVPCAPFVQGLVTSPGQLCCDNLNLLYAQVPHCLCIFQNASSSLTSFPINRTLALQLPVLCTMQVNVSDCPGDWTLALFFVRQCLQILWIF